MSASEPGEVSDAKLRWRLLASCVRKGNLLNDQDAVQTASKRRALSYDLFTVKQLESDGFGKWSQWNIKSESLKSSDVFIRIIQQHLSTKELAGFNNTGNVCIWPSEEILAYYCLQHKEIFSERNVCEIGAGMTALAGIVLACHVDASLIQLTDGNKVSVDNIRAIVDRNSPSFQAKRVDVSNLLWSTGTSLGQLTSNFDVVVGADCLFFEEAHEGLIYVLDSILVDEGIILLFAPSRGGSFERFAKLASSRFDVTVTDNYDDVIWSQHSKLVGHPQYDQDRHFVKLITMKHKHGNKDRHMNGVSNSS